MELHQVHVVGLHAHQAPVYGFPDRLTGPRGAGEARGQVACFGGEDELAAPVGDGVADELFSVAVALRSVQEVDPRV